MDDPKVGASSEHSAAEEARGFEALVTGDKKIVAGGPGTTAHGPVATVLPDAVTGVLHRDLAEPGSADRPPRLPEGPR